jgi:hypothetical protein
MDNPLTRLIHEGKIRNLQQLKSTYRTLVMKTHPDAVGSDRLVEGYLSLSSFYEEARRFFENKSSLQEQNHRLAYFQILEKLERIDKPYSFHRQQNHLAIRALQGEAWFHFRSWNEQYEQLYVAADREYDRIKSGKPSGPYMKHALAINMSPTFHNIVAYHLTGMSFYKQQVNQNLKAILQRLVVEEYPALKEFIELLIGDMDNGPAVFGKGKRILRKKSPWK